MYSSRNILVTPQNTPYLRYVYFLQQNDFIRSCFFSYHTLRDILYDTTLVGEHIELVFTLRIQRGERCQVRMKKLPRDVAFCYYNVICTSVPCVELILDTNTRVFS